MTVLAILPTLALVSCLHTEAAPPTPQEQTVAATDLERKLRQVPDGDRRLQEALIALMPAAAVESAEVWTARLDAVTSVLADTHVSNSNTARNLLEARWLDSDRILLAGTVLARLREEPGWEELCAARWRVKGARDQILAGLDGEVVDPGLMDARRAARIKRLTLHVNQETREIMEVLVDGVDMRGAKDDASLLKALSNSRSGRTAIWHLGFGFILEEEIMSLDFSLPAIEEEGPRAYEAMPRLHEVHEFYLEQYDRLAERCGRLYEVVRQNHLEGIRITGSKGMDSMAIMGLQYLTTGWDICLSESTTIEPGSGVQFILDNPAAQAQLDVVAASPSEVKLLIAVRDLTTGVDLTSEGDGGWASLAMPSPARGQIRVRVYNTDSVPAEINIKAYYDPLD